MGSKKSRWRILVSALAVLALTGCSGVARDDCREIPSGTYHACSGTAVYEYSSCGRKRELVEQCDAASVCVDERCVSAATAQDACAAAGDCGECVTIGLCGWCDGRCEAGSFVGPQGGSCSSWSWSDVDCAAPNPCTDGGLAPGSYEFETDASGLARRYLVRVPVAASGLLPVVFDFHGWSGTPEQQARESGMASKADEAGFIAIHPAGYNKSWNAGTCCGDAFDYHVDDVAFVRQILDEMAARSCVDRSRVYATGFSNGGFMSHYLACEAADTFSAVAPVSGVLGLDGSLCTPARPVAVLQIHGTNDLAVNFYGNPSFPSVEIAMFPSVRETVEGWARRDGCDADPTTVSERGAFSWERYGHCSGRVSVELVSHPGGHFWPQRLEGVPTADRVWSFLSQFRLRPHAE